MQYATPMAPPCFRADPDPDDSMIMAHLSCCVAQRSIRFIGTIEKTH